MRNVLACLTMLATACAAVPREEDRSASASSADASVPDAIEGYYRVAGAGGQDVDLPWGMTVVIEGGRITLESQCIRPVWTYRYDAGQLATRRAPAAICRRAIMPAEQAAMDAIDSAEFAIRTPENAVVLQGEGGTLTLFSQ